MKPISTVVEQELLRQPFLADVLSSGYGNITAIARKLKPRIEATMLKRVTLSSISMALRRFVASQAKVRKAKKGEPAQAAEVLLRSNMTEFLFANSAHHLELHRRVATLHSRHPNAFTSLSKGERLSSLLVSQELVSEIQKILRLERRVKRLDHVAIVSVRFSDREFNRPGIFYPLVKALALSRLSFLEIISVGTEISFVFASDVAPQAYSIIQSVLRVDK